jgi:hypothetical protein
LGSPPCATNPGITQWKARPSAKPFFESVMKKLSTVLGASSGKRSIRISPPLSMTMTALGRSP